MKTNGTIQISLSLAMSAMLFLSSCDKLKGDGENVIRIAPVDSFLSIDIDIPCTINLSYDNTQELTIEAQNNIQNNIVTRVESQILHVEFVQKPYDYNPITLTLKVPYFRNVTIRDNNVLTVTSPFITDSRICIDVHGEGDILFTDTVKCYAFRYKASGYASLRMAYLESQYFNYTVTGYTNATLTGTTKCSQLFISGSSEFHGFNFLTQNTLLNVSGSSDITELHVKNTLKTEVACSATVIYKGDPLAIDNSASTGDLNISASE